MTSNPMHALLQSCGAAAGYQFSLGILYRFLGNAIRLPLSTLAWAARSALWHLLQGTKTAEEAC